MTGPERETELLRAFAVASRRDRYVELLATRKGREKVRLGLDHFSDLDPKRCTRIAAGDQTPTRIAALLGALGAPGTCYVLSSNSVLDGCEMEVGDALEAADPKSALKRWADQIKPIDIAYFGKARKAELVDAIDE